MKVALLVAWRVLLSLPLAVLWMGMFGLLAIGWGLGATDSFIKNWNNFVEEGPFGP